MKADQYFLKLGYGKVFENEEEIVYNKIIGGEIIDVVWFYLQDHTYANSAVTTVALHYVIDLKVDELGWFEIRKGGQGLSS